MSTPKTTSKSKTSATPASRKASAGTTVKKSALPSSSASATGKKTGRTKATTKKAAATTKKAAAPTKKAAAPTKKAAATTKKAAAKKSHMTQGSISEAEFEQVLESYLGALGKQRRPGRPRKLDSTHRRLEEVENLLTTASTSHVARLKLMQERTDLLETVEELNQRDRQESLERTFIAMAKAFSDQNKISPEIWRAAGVEDKVLRAAGITE